MEQNLKFLIKNLSRRGVLLDSYLCPLCNAAMEDVQHVFFRCDVARVVLRKICRWWDLDWQEICSFSDWDAWFLSFRLSSRLKSILEGVFYVAWWRIWRLRNQLVFDASPSNRSSIFDDIVSWYLEYSQLCKCKFPLVRRTAWTDLNPCRRFLNYRKSNVTSKKSCDAFFWIDLELHNGW
ncbi:RNA-directed DNA polymerase, eukaryota [Tanacetum coccineum]